MEHSWPPEQGKWGTEGNAPLVLSCATECVAHTLFFICLFIGLFVCLLLEGLIALTIWKNTYPLQKHGLLGLLILTDAMRSWGFNVIEIIKVVI